MRALISAVFLMTIMGCHTQTQDEKASQFVQQHHCKLHLYVHAKDEYDSYYLSMKHSPSRSYYTDCDVRVDNWVVVAGESEPQPVKEPSR